MPPRRIYAGVVYGLLFLALLIWAIKRDLQSTSPSNHAQSTQEAFQDSPSPNEQLGESKPLSAGVTLLDIATLILAFSTIGLWLATRRGIDTQIKDTRILQRAYLSVEPGGIRPFASDDGRIACDIIIANAGNLPARNVAWFISRLYSRNAHETNFPRNNIRPVGDIVIAPRTKIIKGADPTNIAAFRTNIEGRGPYSAWLYVWGRISYHDGFTPGRYIDFCHRYNMHGASAFVIPAENGRYHEHGNGTDEYASPSVPDVRPQPP